VHKLGSSFFFCLQGISEKRYGEMPMLWQWIRRASVVGEKWKSVDQAVAFIQRADQVGYVERKNKTRKCELSTEKYKSV
jgi:hypothetical protein